MVITILIILLGANTIQGSLMSRIGLRLSGKKIHETHKNRVPWAVKQMREDLCAAREGEGGERAGG